MKTPFSWLLAALLAAVATTRAADTTPPTLSFVSPTPGGTLSNLIQITIRFSEPVLGVEADDLLVNGNPALGVTNAGGTNFGFSFSKPAPGLVAIYFEVDHGITDIAGNRFDESALGASWTYTLLDSTPPTTALLEPAAGAAVSRLTAVEVTFSEPVTGVNASDLAINNGVATNVSGSGVGPYHFEFPAPAEGIVNFAWAANHGIRDAAGNPFSGAAWAVAFNAAVSNAVIVINEILAGNERSTGLRDENNELSDWLELVNRGTAPVNLLGWSLSNDAEIPDLWTFPAVTLQPGQFLVVFVSGKDRRPAPPGKLHTNFKLSRNGDFLGLFNADLPRRPVSTFAPKYPVQRNDYSFGFDPANALRYFTAPSPGTNNGASTVATVCEPVSFSAPRGFYGNPFTLYLSTATPGATIRYTTDGSEPTATTGQLYAGPFAVANTAVIRAAAFNGNALPSVTKTHSFLFPEKILAQPANPPGVPTQWISQSGSAVPADYQMDPRVIANAAYQEPARLGLTSVPTLSVVLKPDDLFSQQSGIYANPGGTGLNWEKAASAEWIFNDGSAPVQIDAGYRIQGGSSRDANKTYKHSMRLLFRGTYGAGEWEYPFFPDSPVESFNTLVVDALLNLVWTHRTDATQRQQGQYVRDQFLSDLFNAAGRPAFHGRYFNLFLNGLYWGLHVIHERPDAFWAATYYGGSSTNWDIIKSTTAYEVIAGNDVAWNQLLALSTRGLTNNAQYEQLRQLCDVPNLIDYMIFNVWAGNTDWPHHNWYVGRERRPGATFKFFTWDAEHILKSATEDRSNANNAATPAQIYDALRLYNPEFRLQFADQIHRHFFNRGVLYVNPAAPNWDPAHPENNRPAAFYLKRIAEIDPAIVLESARWGDTINNTVRPGFPYERNFEWSNELTRLVTSYFPTRSATVLAQFKALNLYPAVAAPAFSQHGGNVPRRYPLAITAPAGIIYYTTNGVDPRVPLSGVVAADARRYTNGFAVVLDRSVVVKARVLSGATWSALNETVFSVASLGVPVHLTEIMYNPPGGDAYEFLELRNDGPAAMDVSGWAFEGINFAFPFGSVIAPGQLIVLANNGSPADFAARYPGVSVFGWFGGQLNNGGERLTLRDTTGRVIFSVEYGDGGAWPREADGSGYSLEVADAAGDPDAPANWRATSLNGTPGGTSASPPESAIVLNEVMAHNAAAVSHDGAFPDWVEIANRGAGEMNLAGWSLADAGQTFVFPNDAVVPAGGFLMVWCDAVTNSPGLHAGFNLDRHGEGLALFNAATGRVDAVSFGLQLPDLTLGRFGDDWGLGNPTPGAANVPVSVASPTNVVINEWLANAPPGGSDWVELFNPGPLPISLRGIYLGNGEALDQMRLSSFIAPGGFAQIFCDAQPGADHVGFKLSAAGGAIVFYDDSGTERIRVAFGTQTEGITQGRLPDGAGTIAAFPGTASPAASNYISTYSGPRLNEILAVNSGFNANHAGHFADWIELFNPNPASFDLAGFRLSTALDQPAQWTFPTGVSVPASSYLVVWFDPAAPASTNAMGELNIGKGLQGGSDEVFLFNTAGQFVDSLAFGPQVPDQSIGVTDGQWQLLAQPTPGAANAPASPLAGATGLRFNEWLASPPDDADDYFELFNTNAVPVALAGLYLTDDLTTAGQTQFQIASLSFVGGRGFVAFKADGDPSKGRNHVNFYLDGDGDSLRLTSTNLSILDTVSFGLQVNGISQGWLPDGFGSITNLPALTPGASNLNGYTNVSVVALLPAMINEAAPMPGAFLIARSAGTNGALIVAFTLEGTASNGMDFAEITSPVIIPASVTSVVVWVQPLDDALPETPETVVLNLTPTPGYYVTLSSSAVVTISDDDNQAPVVALTSPTSGTLLLQPTNVTLSATTSDPDGSVARVEYLANGLKVGESLTPPFDFTWTNAPGGRYALVAQASDNLGKTTDSAPVSLVVNALPSMALTCPKPNEVFAAPVRLALAANATDADGAVVLVEFFVNGSPAGSGRRAPFGVIWDGATPGSYTVTARATDDRGVSVWSAPASISVGVSGADSAFIPPPGGWTYLYDGVGVLGGSYNPTNALDGSWGANNSSSAWDGQGRGPGTGAPGGISSLNGILTIEDLNSSGSTNRKIYFTRELSLDAATTNAARIVDDGLTLTFRTRLAPPDIQPPAFSNNLPDGWGLFAGAKAMFNVHQYNAGLHSTIGFSLVRAAEPDSSNLQFPAAGLTFNRLNGNLPSTGIDSTTVAVNNPVLPLDPTVFHEFWITIRTNRFPGSNGTHTVDIYVDGSTEPFTANVTAGTGAERNTSYLGMGLNNSLGSGCYDVDFFGYRQGVHPPAASVTPVAICVPPQPQFVIAGGAAQFTVLVAGSLPLSYQWRFNGANLAGETNQSLLLAGVQADRAGGYSVIVANPSGSVTSVVAQLVIVSPPVLGNPALLAGDVFQGFVTGPATVPCVIEVSEDLVHWIRLDTVILTGTPLPFLDPGAVDERHRFYRARLSP